jgi:CubicO group peptidase (beta-lactamase class C family)
MSELTTTVDPATVGLDADRLERISSHFDEHVQKGRLPGWLSAIGRDGELAWVGRGGCRDVESGIAVEPDTIWRIYSMTKPVTSIAAMLLHEEGRFDLNDDVAAWLPEFAEPRVYVEGPPDAPITRPAAGPIRVWHLLTHTAGLTYGFQRCHPVDAIYRLRGYEWSAPQDRDLAAAVEDFASMPLVFDPGSAWNYSVATDVVGRLVEVWSGQPFDRFLTEQVLVPLGMTETGFLCPEEHLSRLAELYVYAAGDTYTHGGAMNEAAKRRPSIPFGGAGLVSTADNYHRFATMLLRGGALDDARLVSASTISLMSRNFLPGGVDLESLARDTFAESSMSGVGFGLGLSCVLDPSKLHLSTTEGTLSWGGAASTTFWVDPQEDLTCVFFTQLLPSTSYPIRRELQRLVYQAIID